MTTAYYPTRHAALTMARRNVSWAEVLGVLARPEVVYRPTSGPHAGKNTQTYQRGPLYVIASTVPIFASHDTGQEHPLLAVVTVGLRSTHQWTDDDARNRTVRLA